MGSVHVAQTTTAERLVVEGHELLEVQQEDHEELVIVLANGEGEAADANATPSLAP